METYKIKKDIDDTNISHTINNLYKKLVNETYKSIEGTKLNTDYNTEMYKESMVGHRISRFQNNNNRVNHMQSNKAIAFSSLVE
jgi:hypothetical protein